MKIMYKLNHKSVILLSMLLLSKFVKAGEEVALDGQSVARYESNYSYYLMIGFIVATIIGFIFAAYRIFGTKENLKEESAINKMLYDAVPVERENEIMTDHEYDGIKELDNHLPPWWVWLGYMTILFSIVYTFYYEFSDYGKSQEEEYAEEMAYAQNQKEDAKKALAKLFDESKVKVVTDAAKLEDGKQIFQKNCVACHLSDGGGSVGPNLTDKFFIHGSSSTEMYAVIKEGVLSKGMLSWKNQFSPFQMQNIMSYIKTELEGTTPANPKEPQGEEIK